MQTQPVNTTSQVFDQPDESNLFSQKNHQEGAPSDEGELKELSPSPTVQDIVPGSSSKEKLDESQPDFEADGSSKKQDSHSQQSSQNKLGDNFD